MRKFLLLSAVLFFAVSCGQSRGEAKDAQIVQTNLDLAKATLEEMLVNVERMEKNEISEDRFNSVSVPLAKRLDSLNLKFDENEKLKFRNYSNGRFHKEYPYSLD